MKKRQLFSLVVTVLLLCTLIPTLAFAADVADNPSGTTLDELASGDFMETNYGIITNNNGTIGTNHGTVTNNNGTIGDSNTFYNRYNRGLVTNNYGTLFNTTSAAVIKNNYGNSYYIIPGNGLKCTITNNFGTASNSNVSNNYGSANAGGCTVASQFLEVVVTGGEHTTNTLTRANNKQWIADNTYFNSSAGNAEFTPDSGYKITAATTNHGKITKNTDGGWTLSEVKNVNYSETVNVTLTVTTATPKTGVNRDTGILTALALVSGLVLVTALPKKKTGA